MNKKDSKVSVIIPVYNAAKYIEETIQSILNQTHKNWELILIDDGSSDASVDIIKRYTDEGKIFLLQHSGCVNLGVSKTRELGIKFSKGEYIAFLDADDIFYPNKLSEQLNVFTDFKDVILVHSKAEIINDFESTFNNEFVLHDSDKLYKINEQENWLKANAICNSTVIVKANILKNIKFGLPQLFQFEDWLLWSLLAEKGPFYYQNTSQIKYRLHSTSATAAILKNRLIAPYSKIEYLISLYFLNESYNSNHKIIGELKESFINLLEIYSNKNIDNVNAFRSDIYTVKDENNMYVEKYNELISRYNNLEKEFEEIYEIKNSKLYKLVKRIKNIFS